MQIFLRLSLAASHNLVPLSCSTIAMFKQVEQQQGKHMIRRQAPGGCRVNFLRLAFLFLLRWHLLNLSFVLSLRLQGGQGYRRRSVAKVGKDSGRDRNRARAGWAGRQVRKRTGYRRGQLEQGWRRQPSPGEAKWALRRGCALHALLMGLSKKLKLIRFYFIQLHLSINFLV